MIAAIIDQWEDNVTENNNLQALMQQAINAFQPEKAAGMNAQIQFHITGNQGGDWVAMIHDQKLSVEQGTTPNPNLTLSADTQDLFKMVQGKLNPMQAYMQGKVQIKGDMGLAMRLMNLFKLP
jgi:putative sterol carrier protein